jgi:hypothetical protein
VLLRSWVAASGLAGRAGWVPAAIPAFISADFAAAALVALRRLRRGVQEDSRATETAAAIAVQVIAPDPPPTTI